MRDFVGQPLLAVPVSVGTPAADSQEWLSYKITSRSKMSGVLAQPKNSHPNASFLRIYGGT
jgi:hypothetical protein